MAQRLSSEQLKSSLAARFRFERRGKGWTAGSAGDAGRAGIAGVAGVANTLRQALLPEADSSLPVDVPRQAETPDSAVAVRRDAAQRLARLVPRLVIGGAVLMLVVALALFAFRAAYSGRVYPAVVVGDVPVGGLTMAQAENRLMARANELEQGVVTFTYRNQTWTPTLTQLGATVDLERSLAIAHTRGREDDALTRLAFAGSILRSDQTVPLHTNVDGQQLEAWFDQVDKDLGQPAVNAALAINDLEVSITPDKDGLVVNREAARAQVLQALTTLESVTIELPTEVQAPELRVADLAQAREDVRGVVAQHVEVAFEGEVWTLNRKELASFLTVETGVANGRPDVVLAMDQKKLAALLREKFSDQINRKPVDAKVRWSDDGGLYAKEPSVDGVTLKASSFAAVVAKSFLGDHHRVEIPVVMTKPAVDDDNLDALKVETRLGRGDSNYDGGSNERNHNIEVGVGLLNGNLVKPGEEFSFNGAIGAITAEKGYVEASVVVAERAGRDVGGGICQVSTTVFRAALKGGFPITTWHPHTYRLSGYERDGWGPGYDASILQEGDDPAKWGDFKFENDTDGWLYIEAWTEYPYVIVNIYGPKMDRTVEFSPTSESAPITDNEDIEYVKNDLPPGTIQLAELPMNGWEVSFVRIVKDGDGKVLYERNFQTHFKGRGNVYAVSPDMKGKSPAG